MHLVRVNIREASHVPSSILFHSACMFAHMCVQRHMCSVPGGATGKKREIDSEKERKKERERERERGRERKREKERKARNRRISSIHVARVTRRPHTRTFHWGMIESHIRVIYICTCTYAVEQRFGRAAVRGNARGGWRA